YSKAFVSEIISLLVWPKIRFVLNYQKIAALESEIHPSMSISHLPPISRMVPTNRLREQNSGEVQESEEEVLAQNLVSPQEITSQSSSSESESEEEWSAMD
ncbi:E1B 19K, partial [Harbour porpoise adenovirus 1]